MTATAMPSHAGPPIEPCATDGSFPSAAEAVVVGGGIVGVSTALSLAERGIPVVLCEKGALAAEQSSRNWGWVRTMGRDPRELPLMVEAMRLWDRLQHEHGLALGFRRRGIVYLCDDRAVLGRRLAWLASARDFQLDSRMLGRDELARVLPGGSGQWLGALYTPSDGCAEPQQVVPALAARARTLGATIVTGCAVRGIEAKAGRISAVVTERGRIDCSAVVLAAGAWSRLFCRSLGIILPQLKVLNSAMQVDGVDDGPASAALCSAFAFRRRADGGYTVSAGAGGIADIVPDSFRFFRRFLPMAMRERRQIRLRVGRRFLDELRWPERWPLDAISPFERVRVLDPRPARRELAAGLAALAARFPAFRGATVRWRWAGLIDVTPDALPVISGVDALPGFYLATGFSGHGFGIGPAAGRLMADLVAGKAPVVDPAAFRFSRFSKGTSAAGLAPER